MSFGGINTLQQFSTDYGLGHNGVKISLNYFDGIPESALINALESNEIKLIFKSLLKRDETTKERACADLLKLLNDYKSNEYIFDNDIFSLCWSQVYAKLLMSESKIIRSQSHQITTTLIRVLNKRISKFLKDLIPLVLMGTCDTDASVTKSTKLYLSEAFNHNPKKIHTLWTAFHEQILNLVKEAIVIENEGTLSDERYVNKENSILRYHRVMTSAILLLNNLVRINHDHMGDYKSTYRAILKEESLWKLLNLKDTNNLKTYEALLQLLNTLFSVGYMIAHKETFKMATRSLLKSLSQVTSKNVLKLANTVPVILTVLASLDTYKDGRIWTYEKAFKDKLIAFLSVTTTTTCPEYYEAMYALYDKSSDHELLNYNTEWFPLWRKSVHSLNNKLVLGRFGAECLSECWKYYLTFAERGKLDPDLVRSDIMSTLNNGKSLSKLPALRQTLSDSVAADYLTQKLQEFLTTKNEVKVEYRTFYLDNLLVLLADAPSNERAIYELLKFVFNSVSNETGAISETCKEELQIYRFFIKTKLEFLSEELAKFVHEIPVWLDRDSYDLLSGIIVDYTNSVFIDKNKELVTSLEDFFIAASAAGIPTKRMIATLSKINDNAYQKLSSCDQIRNLLQEYIKSYDYSDNGELLKSHLVNEDTIIRVYEYAAANRRLDDFCNHISCLDSKTKKTLFEHTSILPSCLFTVTEENAEILFKVALVEAESGSSIAEILAKTLLEHASEGGFESLDYAVKLLEVNPSVSSIFSPKDKLELFGNNVPFIDYRFALVNGLGLNTHLLDLSIQPANLAQLRKFINYSFFLDHLIARLPDLTADGDIIFLTMVSELAGDYNCVSSVPNDSYYDFKNTVYKSPAYSCGFSELIEQLLDTSDTAEPKSFISELSRYSVHASVTLYKFRILSKILLNEAESISQASFNKHIPSIEAFVGSVIRNKNENSQAYLLISIIFVSLVKFQNSESLTKLRTILASQCIGASTIEFVNEGYRAIILLNNLLTHGSDTANDVLPITTQRLNMVLKTVSGLLDSDLVYQEEFSVVRLSLLSFLNMLLKFPAIKEVRSSIFEISARLLMDSLSMCQLEETAFLLELRLYSLNLYLQLLKFDRELLESTYDDEIHDSLTELCFINFAAEINNQISAGFYRALDKAMSTLPTKKTMPYFNQFYENFLAATSDECYINHVRLIASILAELISEKQQEAVIEFEFIRQQRDKSKEDENEEDLSSQETFKLPQDLVAKLTDDMPQDYLEYENQYNFIKYLWYWEICLSYLHEVSYNLRQLYIDQLRSEDLLNKILDFLSDQIDLQDTKFWTDAGPQAIADYNFTQNEFSPYRNDIFLECKHLLGHCMFDLFNNIGSLVSSWWLNIKDKSTQSKIEKFVSQFISPILINHELEDVQSKMDRLTSKDDSLTIKINKVTNEVKASYLIDDQKLELSFKLPSNYPLTNVQVIGVSRVGISEQKWKQWIMSTQRVITGMNGSVADSLELFTKNVNLQFSGFEECAICYSILHAVDRKLPTKTCPTCNNKFHGSCLYKWFRSSGNNTCPLCRGEIPFRR